MKIWGKKTKSRNFYNQESKTKNQNPETEVCKTQRREAHYKIKSSKMKMYLLRTDWESTVFARGWDCFEFEGAVVVATTRVLSWFTAAISFIFFFSLFWKHGDLDSKTQIKTRETQGFKTHSELLREEREREKGFPSFPFSENFRERQRWDVEEGLESLV